MTLRTKGHPSAHGEELSGKIERRDLRSISRVTQWEKEASHGIRSSNSNRGQMSRRPDDDRKRSYEAEFSVTNKPTVRDCSATFNQLRLRSTSY
jgi:hypothetical protein